LVTLSSVVSIHNSSLTDNRERTWTAPTDEEGNPLTLAELDDLASTYRNQEGKLKEAEQLQRYILKESSR